MHALIPQNPRLHRSTLFLGPYLWADFVALCISLVETNGWLASEAHTTGECRSAVVGNQGGTWETGSQGNRIAGFWGSLISRYANTRMKLMHLSVSLT